MDLMEAAGERASEENEERLFCEDILDGGRALPLSTSEISNLR